MFKGVAAFALGNLQLDVIRCRKGVLFRNPQNIRVLSDIRLSQQSSSPAGAKVSAVGHFFLDYAPFSSKESVFFFCTSCYSAAFFVTLASPHYSGLFEIFHSRFRFSLFCVFFFLFVSSCCFSYSFFRRSFNFKRLKAAPSSQTPFIFVSAVSLNSAPGVFP